jgi:adenylate cyclase
METVTDQGVQRRLAAILAADVVGYSRMIGLDETGTLARLRRIRHEIVNPVLAEHGGRIFKLMGDGLLAEFPSAVQALRAAIAIQERMRSRNEQSSDGEPIEVRIGVHQGDVVVEGRDLLGDGVNVAARLEALATPGGICVSARVQEDAVGRITINANDLGEQTLKNIARPVRAYRVSVGLPKVTGRQPAEERRALPLPDKPSIAVLPFANMSGDPEQEYFAEGIVEDIITALSRFRQLFVIARNSSFTYKGKAVDVKQVGRDLGVRYVLEGSVRKAASRVRITSQLIDAGTGAHLWADRFDGDLADIFELQDQIASNVVGAIAPRLEQAEIERVNRKPTDSLDAYDYFLRAMAIRNQFSSREANEETLHLVTRAIELDANFALAYAMAAHYYVVRKASGWLADPGRETADAIGLARRAMELAGDDALALAISGLALAHMGRDLNAGVALMDRALVLNPNLAVGWYYRSWLKIWLGEPSSALESIGRAMRLSPLDPYMPRLQNAIAHAHFFLGHYDEASSSAAVALRDFPNFHDALRVTAASNALAGRKEEAQNAVKRLLQLDPALRVSKLREIQGPYRRSEDLTIYEEAMRRAGLPE